MSDKVKYHLLIIRNGDQATAYSRLSEESGWTAAWESGVQPQFIQYRIVITRENEAFVPRTSSPLTLVPPGMMPSVQAGVATIVFDTTEELMDWTQTVAGKQAIACSDWFVLAVPQ